MKRKRYFALILILMVIINSMAPAKTALSSTKKEKNCLILVEQTKGNWIAYDSLVRYNSSGDAFVSAEIISMALGYSYEEHTRNNEIFMIGKTGNIKSNYTINSKQYTYQSGGSKVTRSSSSEAAIKKNNITYCQLSTLKELCNVSYFKGNAIKEYKKYSSIDGVYCLSNAGKVAALPKATKVKTPYHHDWYKTFVDLNVEEPGETTLYGVTFIARDHFLQKYEIGYGPYKPTQLEIEMNNKAEEYTIAYRKANNIEPDTNQQYRLAVTNATLDMSYDKNMFNASHTINVSSSRINNVDYWKVSILMDLSNKEYDLNTLKALCYFLSSTPETLYNVISYDFFKRSVVPEFIGIGEGTPQDKLIGEFGRQYGDFIISVSENNEYSGRTVPDIWSMFSTVSYYIRQAE